MNKFSFSFVLFISLLVMGCNKQFDPDIDSKYHFYGINLLTLDEAPICPESFFAPDPRDRGNILQSNATYLCKQRFPGNAILIPKDRNPLNVIWISFTKPLYEGEQYYIKVYFNSYEDEKRIMQYLISKYGEPHKTEGGKYWRFEEEEVEIYLSSLLIELTIYFPRSDIKQ